MAAAASASSSSSSESVGPANSSSPPIVTDTELFRNGVTCSSTERVHKGGAANRGPTPAVLHHAVVASWNAIGVAQLHALQHVGKDVHCSTFACAPPMSYNNHHYRLLALQRWTLLALLALHSQATCMDVPLLQCHYAASLLRPLQAQAPAAAAPHPPEAQAQSCWICTCVSVAS